MATLPPKAAAADNLLGVCAAIGEATGLPPIVARLAFVCAVLAGWFEPAIAAYLILALAVAAARYGAGHRR